TQDMNFGGHLMAGWLIANAATENAPERRAITLMAIAPDLDGVFMFVSESGRELHRTFGHNVFFALVIPLITIFFLSRNRRMKILPLLYISMASHFILDLFVTGWWILTPFWPVSDWGILMTDWISEDVMKYYIQIGLFIIFIIPTVYIIIKKKRTPFEILGTAADRFLQTFVTLPFRSHCAYCNARAFYLCEKCGAALCGRHRRFSGIFKPICRDSHQK
ncbi:metal-dependent hydrolase, partial [Candidatus Sumerlaeota bacterium]|nr:metal-dependent hydrolase [Candidatus Sumerlaeota bacterium]